MVDFDYFTYIIDEKPLLFVSRVNLYYFHIITDGKNCAAKFEVARYKQKV